MRTQPKFTRWRIRSSCFVALFCCFPLVLCATEIEHYPTQEYLEKLQAFCEAHPDDPSAILAEEDLSIQLAAYWRYVNRFPTDRKIVNIHALMHARNKFIGLLTSRLGESPPQWWKDSLVKESLSFTDEIQADYLYYNYRTSDGKYLSRRDDEKQVKKLAEHQNGYFAAGVSAFEKPNSLSISQGGKLQVLSLEARNVILDGDLPFAGVSTFATGSAFFQKEAETASPFFLYWVSPEGKLIWKADSWGNGDWVQLTPIGRSEWSWDPELEKYTEHHFNQITIQANQLTLYGADFSGAYVEQFNLKTGNNILRFSTRYANPDNYDIPRIRQQR